MVEDHKDENSNTDNVGRNSELDIGNHFFLQKKNSTCKKGSDNEVINSGKNASV